MEKQDQLLINKLTKRSLEKIEENFGWFVKAYNYGAPPHRGCALGLDRIVTILEDKPSIRDVIAFPKTQKASCVLTKAPSPVDNTQLRDLHIRLREQKK